MSGRANKKKLFPTAAEARRRLEGLLADDERERREREKRLPALEAEKTEALLVLFANQLNQALRERKTWCELEIDHRQVGCTANVTHAVFVRLRDSGYEVEQETCTSKCVTTLTVSWPTKEEES